MSLPKPTSEEIGALKYFWQEKGDVTRYVGWKQLQPKLAEHHPEVLAALSNLKVAYKTVSAVISVLDYPDE